MACQADVEAGKKELASMKTDTNKPSKSGSEISKEETSQMQ